MTASADPFFRGCLNLSFSFSFFPFVSKLLEQAYFFPSSPFKTILTIILFKDNLRTLRC